MKSRIKNHLEKDKKKFNLLKKNNYDNNERPISNAFYDNSPKNEKIESFQCRTNKFQEELPKTNFLIEFDKNLEVRNIHEKSKEKPIFDRNNVNKNTNEKSINNQNRGVISNNYSYKQDCNEDNNSNYNNSYYNASNNKSNISNQQKDLNNNINDNY